MKTTDHLALAKEDLEIAESGNAKREAYKRAADHIAAYRKDSDDKDYRRTAASYCNTSVHTIDKLVKWHGTGFKADTPFLMDDQATNRAARSHTKSVLKDPEQRKAAIDALAKDDPSVVADIAKAAIDATSDKDAQEVSGHAIDRSIDASRKKRRDQKADREKKNEDSGEFDPNERERERVLRKLGTANIAISDAVRVALATPWNEADAEVIGEKLDKTDGLVARARLAITGQGDVDWDEALAELTAE